MEAPPPYTPTTLYSLSYPFLLPLHLLSLSSPLLLTFSSFSSSFLLVFSSPFLLITASSHSFFLSFSLLPFSLSQPLLTLLSFFLSSSFLFNCQSLFASFSLLLVNIKRVTPTYLSHSHLSPPSLLDPLRCLSGRGSFTRSSESSARKWTPRARRSC